MQNILWRSGYLPRWEERGNSSWLHVRHLTHRVMELSFSVMSSAVTSDGKLSIWVDRERKKFKRCNSLVTILSTQAYSCSSLKTQISEFIFQWRFNLFSLRLGIIINIVWRRRLSALLSFPLWLDTSFATFISFRITSNLCFPALNVTDNKDNGKRSVTDATLLHLQVQTRFQFSMLKGISSEP